MSETVKLKKPRKRVVPWSVVIDTREQRPFLFGNLVTRSNNFIVKATKKTLQQGDYAIDGLEEQYVVERKSLEDLYQTLTWGHERFMRELTRIMDCCRAGAVVIEGDWDAIADPQSKRMDWRSDARPQSIIGCIYACMVRYPRVQWMPQSTRESAEWCTFNLLRFAYDQWAKEQFDGENNGLGTTHG